MKKEDLEKLAEIYVEAYTKINIGERWTFETAKELLSHWLEKQPDLAFVAEYNNKIVGAFVAGIKPWWDGNHLVDGEIFVHNDFQKKGIGTALSIALFTKALEKYKVSFYDAVTYTNHKFPLSWYKSLGLVSSENLVLISGNVKSILSKLKKNSK